MKLGWLSYLLPQAHRFAGRGLSTACSLVGLLGCVERDPHVITDSPVCRTCTIVIDTLAVIGESEGSGQLSTVLGVAVDKDHYWVFGQGVPPKQFDESGVFTRVLGRQGQGPGEFVGAHHMWSIPGDSIMVLDSRGLHVVGPNLEFNRTEPRPLLGVHDALILSWPTEVVVNALHPIPPQFGHPFHIVDFSVEVPRVVTSFGAAAEPITQSMMYTRLPHALAPSQQGGYWAVPMDQYDLQKWGVDHTKKFTLRRRPRWFQERSNLSDGHEEKAPSPRCVGVAEDSVGLLWLYCLTAAPDYAAAYADTKQPARSSGTAEVSHDRVTRYLLYQTQIEVLDVQAQAVVATSRLDHMLTSVLSDQRIAVEFHRPDGSPMVHILRLSLRGYERN